MIGKRDGGNREKKRMRKREIEVFTPNTLSICTHLEVHAFSTVCDHTEQPHGFGQIFDGLSFPRTSWTSWCPSQVHGEGLSDGEIDPVCQGGDHQTTVQTHVLVAETKLARALPHHDGVGFLFPVEPQLTLPLKLSCLHDTASRAETTHDHS